MKMPLDPPAPEPHLGWRRALYLLAYTGSMSVAAALAALWLLPDPGGHGLGPLVNLLEGALGGAVAGVILVVITLWRLGPRGPSWSRVRASALGLGFAVAVGAAALALRG